MSWKVLEYLKKALPRYRLREQNKYYVLSKWYEGLMKCPFLITHEIMSQHPKFTASMEDCLNLDPIKLCLCYMILDEKYDIYSSEITCKADANLTYNYRYLSLTFRFLN